MTGLEAVFELVCRRSGCALSSQQRERVQRVVEARLSGRAPAHWCAFLDSREGSHTLLELLSAVSVHKTDLFRDEAQLEALAEHVLAPLAMAQRPLRLWSAGCATGEEVATLLLLLDRVGAHPASRVLGTDLSPAALGQARRLTFTAEALRRVPAVLAAKFRKTPTGYELDRALAARASFEPHNLMETPYPFPAGGGGFDVVVCRNVLIYFTPEATEHVVAHLAQRLAPGGTLVLSAAEPLLRPRADLETRRVAGAFFYVPRTESAPAPQLPPVKPPRASALPVTPPVAALPPTAPSPEDEAAQLFALVMEWAAEGQGDATEAGLRKVLYLAPELAAARYCLGLVLERSGRRADATTEYRRALSSLEQGRARATPFFLNPDRLTEACRLALARLRS